MAEETVQLQEERLGKYRELARAGMQRLRDVRRKRSELEDFERRHTALLDVMDITHLELVEAEYKEDEKCQDVAMGERKVLNPRYVGCVEEAVKSFSKVGFQASYPAVASLLGTSELVRRACSSKRAPGDFKSCITEEINVEVHEVTEALKELTKDGKIKSIEGPPFLLVSSYQPKEGITKKAITSRPTKYYFTKEYEEFNSEKLNMLVKKHEKELIL